MIRVSVLALSVLAGGAATLAAQAADSADPSLAPGELTREPVSEPDLGEALRRDTAPVPRTEALDPRPAIDVRPSGDASSVDTGTDTESESKGAGAGSAETDDSAPATGLKGESSGAVRTNVEAAPAPREGRPEPTPEPAAPRYERSGGSLMGKPLPAPADPIVAGDGGESDDVEPGEVVVVHPDMRSAEAFRRAAAQEGFDIKRRRRLNELGLVVSVLRVPDGQRVRGALKRLRERFPEVALDANHRYRPLEAGRVYAARLMGWRSESSSSCEATPAVGLVDSRVATDHPAFRGRRIEQRSFLTAGTAAADPAHGTAIASLIVGTREFGGLLSEATLYVAGVLRGAERGADTTAERVAYALDWLAAKRVAVVNLSLGGPRNRLLELAVQRLLGRGGALVAAAGNAGPDGAPAYPAAQRGVIAVTAIDAELQPFEDANRGDYIDLAAPGVNVWTAAPGGDGAYRSGTSYAAAHVTAALARAGGARGVQDLSAAARDLGQPGRDPVFGHGLVRADGLCR